MRWNGYCGSSSTRTIIIKPADILDIPFCPLFLSVTQIFRPLAYFILWFTVIHGKICYLGFQGQGKLLVSGTILFRPIIKIVPLVTPLIYTSPVRRKVAKFHNYIINKLK
jgi:hypothetical protein